VPKPEKFIPYYVQGIEKDAVSKLGLPPHIILKKGGGNSVNKRYISLLRKGQGPHEQGAK